MAEGYFELRPVGPYSFGASVKYEGRRSGVCAWLTVSMLLRLPKNSND